MRRSGWSAEYGSISNVLPATRSQKLAWPSHTSSHSEVTAGSTALLATADGCSVPRRPDVPIVDQLEDTDVGAGILGRGPERGTAPQTIREMAELLQIRPRPAGRRKHVAHRGVVAAIDLECGRVMCHEQRRSRELHPAALEIHLGHVVPGVKAGDSALE